ncbi:MAG TPA: GTPase Era [Alphaproteobacteria bacterium]|nr:GTPase Era [Rhodospirillaceae bacterium]HRI77643.1 GTPase Era [Alphaproteobacteria bacterium]HRJ66825.1 GTPase Era [Alphaproteobacteria bacterium]
MSEKQTRCGFVGIIGAPNAGKSTLVNQLVGAKVSIVSPKVQTTRVRVMGIVNHGAAQVIFVDTPGIFAPKKRLEKAMVAAAWQGMQDAEVTILLVDASKGRVNDDTRAIIERLKQTGRKIILALNKIDMVKKEKLLEFAQALNAEGIFSDVYMVSALSGDGVERMMNDIARRMPEGPWMFGEDQISDMPMRLLAAEITREKIFLQLGDELPYASTVETESWEDFDDGSVKVSQTIYVMRDTQKAIVLGKGGTRIKKIGQAAREELEEILERRVHLSLFVKVREKWTDDPARYSAWGLDFNS